MRKRPILGIAVSAFVAIALSAGPVLAANPHWIGTPTKTVSGDTLTVRFKAAGLGNQSTVDFTLMASATTFSRCYNKGGNKPQAANKRETATLSTTETFPVRNGQTTGTMTLTAPPSTLECPKGQRVVTESVTFSDVTIEGPGNLSHSF